MAKAILTVPDISCEHCEHTIMQALSPVEGITEVHVDIPTKQVHVSYDETKVGPDTMKDILQEEEYPVASIQ